MKAVGWVKEDGSMQWLGDRIPAKDTKLFVEVPKPAEDRDPIGYTLEPIYAPQPGSIVTQAFILCTSCGSAISANGGPRYNSVCLKCIEQLDLINKLKK
jgi:hypothetical protein